MTLDRTIFSTIATALLLTMLTSIAAKAADADLAEPAVEAPYNWAGPYFGLQFGGIVDGDSRGLQLGAPPADNGNVDGVLGGVLGGYNFQRGNIVFGLDSDFSLTGARDESVRAGIVEINTLSTARLRAGYAFDRVLPYVTGGLAYSFTDFDIEIGSDDEFYLGWTIGGGVEYAITDRINARLQYNYVDLGTERFNIGGTSTNVRLDNIHVIRAGVSIKTDFIWNKIFRR